MITANVKPGKYVVAVSGGVDSMVLLDVLRRQSGLGLVVAHFDHGIRSDSAQDKKLVEDVAHRRGLEFVSQEGRLGVHASEAKARQARYAFLEDTRANHGARAIVTAHHRDDVLETACINLLRGTNRRGLSALGSTNTVWRPLLNYPKAALLEYASKNNVSWREDSTNIDQSYLRNYVRHTLLPKLSDAQRQKFLDSIAALQAVNPQIDSGLLALLETIKQAGGIRRQAFTALNHSLAKEVMAMWIRDSGYHEYDSRMLDRLVIAGKTGANNTVVDVARGFKLCISKHKLALKHEER